MTPEQTQYFDQLALVFVQPGWAEFVKTFQDFKGALTAQAYSFKTMEEYFYAKGRMDCFDQVLGFQSMIEESHKAAQDAADPIQNDA